jgi:4-hydroxy-3-methylbut-2-enyl diphosphate reductase IspH
VARLVREGFHPVIIGKRDHVEVRGMTEDLDAFDVVLARKTWRTARAPALRRGGANHAAD